jgi:hypothetical protein
MKHPGQNICAACGWRHLKEPQRSASGGASNEICPSCGFESGFTDDDQGISHEQWRATWVEGGLTWFSKGIARPAKWNPVTQVHSLLQRKRPVIPVIRLQRAAALRNGDGAAIEPVAAAPKKRS